MLGGILVLKWGAFDLRYHVVVDDVDRAFLRDKEDKTPIQIDSIIELEWKTPA